MPSLLHVQYKSFGGAFRRILAMLIIGIIPGLAEAGPRVGAQAAFLPSGWKVIDKFPFKLNHKNGEVLFIDRYYRENFNVHSYHVNVFYKIKNNRKIIIPFESEDKSYTIYIVRSGIDCISNEFILKDDLTVLRIKNDLSEDGTVIDVLEIAYNNNAIPGIPAVAFNLRYTKRVKRLCKIGELLATGVLQ